MRVPVLALACVLLAAASCRHPSSSPQGADGTPAGATARDARTSPPADGYLRYRLREDPPDMDPAVAADVVSGAPILSINDGIVAFDPETLAVVPAIAESWTVSADATVYDFTIRSDAFFHGGRQVTADDVLYSFTRVLHPDLNAERRWVFFPIKGARAFNDRKADAVAGLEVVSPTHLRVTLEEPFAPFLGQLCMEAGSILPKEVYGDPAAKDAERPWLRHPVGCGPFEFQEWQQGNFLRLRSFDKYYRGKPKLAGITYRFIGDKLTAVQAYKNGELDIVDEIPAGQRRRLDAELPGQYKNWSQLGTWFCGFNQELPPFKGNKKLRQALNYAVNRTYICETLQEGKDSPAYGIVPPGMPGHDPATERDPYDPAKAKALLAEAGYPEGKGLDPIVVWYNTDDSHQRVLQQMQQDFAAIGVRIELRNLDFASYLEAIEGSDQENAETAMYRAGWIADYPDPDNFLTVKLSCDYWGPKGNYDRYCNREFEKLIDEARRLVDMEARLPLYRQAEAIAMEDAVWLPVYYYGEEALVKPYVKGFVLSPQGDFTAPLDRVWFE
jgi:peptide/nickel transport system substrate-binding protein/oligopeptide transport system substrate-binding protein